MGETVNTDKNLLLLKDKQNIRFNKIEHRIVS